MTKRSIEFSPPNDDWVNARIENHGFRDTSEVINDLIRNERKREYVRQKLMEGENSGFTDNSKQRILKNIKGEAKRLGKL